MLDPRYLEKNPMIYYSMQHLSTLGGIVDWQVFKHKNKKVLT